MGTLRMSSEASRSMRLPQPLQGVVPPVATPLAGRDELDVPGLERLIEHLIAGGVHGLFILGTTGEGPALSYRLRAEVIQRTCEQVAGRIPVLVGITDTSLVEALHLSEIAAEADADAVVAAPPYYQPFSQGELIGYVNELANESVLPLFLYNMPALTKIWFERETIEKLVHHPRILGLKDSSGDLEYLRDAVRIAASRPDFSLLIGPEHLLAEALRFGVHGGVSGGANVFPELFVELCRAHAAGDEQAFHTTQQVILQLQDLYRVGTTPACVIQGVKAGLECRGICRNLLAAPIPSLAGEDFKRVESLVERITHNLPVNSSAPR